MSPFFHNTENMIKLYRLRHYAKLSTILRLESGKIIPLDFTPSFTDSQQERGIFLTKEKEVQDAMESDASYGIEWVLESVDGMIPSEYAAKHEGDNGGNDGGNGDGNNGDNNLTPINDISSFQQAKEYMLSTYPELKVSDVNSKAQIAALAAERSIFFPNMPK